MPFKKIAPGKYRGPSGKIFNLAQLRRYYARGHTFDAKGGDTDPTKTLSIRRAFANELAGRWRTVKLAVNKTVRDEANVLPGIDRVKTLSAWFDHALRAAVLGDVSAYIRRGYEQGVTHSSRSPSPTANERIDSLVAATDSDLEGIVDVVSAQATRVMNAVTLTASSSREMAALINRVIDKVGVVRSKVLASTSVVSAHAQGTLDALEAAGVRRVSVIPERHSHTRDSVTEDAPRRLTSAQRGRIDRAERRLNRLNRVNVITAGDDKVCPQCEAIAEDGPYSIDEARGLIPAHPSCRCSFEAVTTEDAGFDPNQPRNEKGEWTSIGEGWHTGLVGNSLGSSHVVRDPSGNVVSGFNSPEEAKAWAERYRNQSREVPEDIQRAAWAEYDITVKDNDALQRLREMGIPPAELYDHMTGGIEDVQLSARVSDYDDALIISGIKHNVNSRSGLDVPDFTFTRSFPAGTVAGLDNDTVYHNLFEVHDDLQGTGIGKQILASQVEMYEKLGKAAVELEANIDRGAYAWAKYGFVPEKDEWKNIARHVNDEAEFEDNGLTFGEKEIIRKITASPDPKSMWALVDTTSQLNRFVKESLENQSWMGRLDLRDHESMRRFRAYVKK